MVQASTFAPEAQGTGRPRLPYVLLTCGALLIPWLTILASTAAPGWLALDSFEAVGLITTAVLALRAHPALPVVAAATAAALLLDAALDLATSEGTARLAAVVMALIAELPLAAACAVLALTAAPAVKAAVTAEVQQPSSRLPR
ncbi:membrane hypothetical protein [Actinacidiphila bryophytorum]|uniref:Uncharacterized protein n=1 Tax=Actinacidiphila bryophytorum TaxID=1436133 RepID=A0A9W4E9S3_9ACTN|nr:membrane hypothetical protein [Actinacidiphila bryophytorum]